MVCVHEYIRIENDEKVKRWIQDTNDINEPDEDGQSPLHVAAFENIEKYAKILLKKGASCNFLDSKGWTPLHCAASAFHFNICQLMILNGKPNLNILTPSGTSALSYLCRTMNDEVNQLKTMKMIIKEGAEIDAANQFGETALHHSCLKGSFGAIKCLVESGANVNYQTTSDKETPIHFAVRAQRGDVIEYLVRNGADINSPDSRGKTVLEKSIELNNSDLEFLIQKLKRDQVPWLELKPNGKWPIPRSNHSSSIYNNRWFMYGGGDSFKTPTTIFSDLFMLNGNTLEWRSLKPKGEEFSPPPLFSHTSVVLGKNLLIFGGNDSEKTFNDIHVLDIEMMTWVPITVNGPYVIRPRSGHTATVISDSLFLVFGGFCGPDYFSDVHIFDAEANKWERKAINNKEMAPSKRSYHTASLIGNLLYIIGGTDGQTYFNDIHILDITTWEWSQPAIKGIIPFERCGHSAVVINQTIILIYGGQDADGEILNDIFAFDTESFTWIEYDISISNHRIARAGHTMEIINFTVYTYGGNSLFALHELLPQTTELNRDLFT